jgi:hypothetical protein
VGDAVQEPSGLAGAGGKAAVLDHGARVGLDGEEAREGEVGVERGGGGLDGARKRGRGEELVAEFNGLGEFDQGGLDLGGVDELGEVLEVEVVEGREVERGEGRVQESAEDDVELVLGEVGHGTPRTGRDVRPSTLGRTVAFVRTKAVLMAAGERASPWRTRR